MGKGLKTKDGGSVTGFALAGDDGRFYWAQAKITGVGEIVTVWSDQVPDPAQLRYAWGDNPVCNLYDLEGLPAVPFEFSFPTKPGGKKPGDDIPPPP
jgi:sialate O-acetylesterase